MQAMNVQWRMDTEELKEKKENFYKSGPSYLKEVDWENQNHTRSIMASLAQGVYVLERDRQEKRTGDKALSLPWYNFFQFQCIKTMLDQIDHSIFGAIFEYKPHAPYHHQGSPPGKYIIVFRGTIIEPQTRTRDLYLDILICQDCLTKDSRYQIALQEINAMLTKVGPNNTDDVVLAGHSLGAAIALEAGKEKAKNPKMKGGCLLKSYDFNPPCPKADLSKKGDDDDSFVRLCSWIPNLFVNPGDSICCDYITYFEQPAKERSSKACGREKEPSFLIPSALLTKNMKSEESHSLDQWWKQNPDLQTKLYKYEK